MKSLWSLAAAALLLTSVLPQAEAGDSKSGFRPLEPIAARSGSVTAATTSSATPSSSPACAPSVGGLHKPAPSPSPPPPRKMVEYRAVYDASMTRVLAEDVFEVLVSGERLSPRLSSKARRQHARLLWEYTALLDPTSLEVVDEAWIPFTSQH